MPTDIENDKRLAKLAEDDKRLAKLAEDEAKAKAEEAQKQEQQENSAQLGADDAPGN